MRFVNPDQNPNQYNYSPYNNGYQPPQKKNPVLLVIIIILSVVLAFLLWKMIFTLFFNISENTIKTALDSSKTLKSSTQSSENKKTTSTKYVKVYSDEYIEFYMGKAGSVDNLVIEDTTYIEYYVVNKSDKKLSLYSENEYINDVMASENWLFSFSCSDILPGKQTNKRAVIYLSSVGLSDVSQIDKIGFSLRIYEADSFETIKETDIIEVPFG